MSQVTTLEPKLNLLSINDDSEIDNNNSNNNNNKCNYNESLNPIQSDQIDNKIQLNQNQKEDVEEVSNHKKEDWKIKVNEPLNKDTEAQFCVGVFKAKKKNKKIDGNDIPNNGECVVKIIAQKQRFTNKSLEYETYKKLKSLDHENVIKIYGFENGDFKNEKDCLFIYMEYLKEYETISDALNKNYKFTEIHIKQVAHYLIFTLAYLNEKHQILHRDIKSSNILIHIENDQVKNIKLIDFGLSKIYNDKSNFNTFVGTPKYMAPEINQKNNKSSSRSDIWSVACTLIEMVGGDLMDKVGPIPTIPDCLSNDCRNFLQYCLILPPLTRPKAIELLNHKFIKSDNLSPINKELSNSLGHKTINKEYPDFNDQDFSKLEKILDINPFSSTSSSEISKINLSLPNFNQPLLSNTILPESVISLSLPLYNHSLIPNAIPSSLTSLVLPSFNQKLEINSIPESITSLTLSTFEQFKDFIPKSVISLTLSNFDKPIESLSIPESITSLSLPIFNQPIKANTLPSKLKTLSIPSFNHDIEDESIPESIIELELGENFEFNENGGNIPSSITKLTCGYKFELPLKRNNNIPKDVTTLKLLNYNQKIIKDSLPKSLYTLELGSDFKEFESLNCLPPNVFNLTFGVGNETQLSDDEIKNSIPKSKTNITINRPKNKE